MSFQSILQCFTLLISWTIFKRFVSNLTENGVICLKFPMLNKEKLFDSEFRWKALTATTTKRGKVETKAWTFPSFNRSFATASQTHWHCLPLWIHLAHCFVAFLFFNGNSFVKLTFAFKMWKRYVSDYYLNESVWCLFVYKWII